MPMIRSLMGNFADNLSVINVFVAIFVFVYTYVQKSRQKSKITLDELFVRTLAGSAIPVGMLLMFCALDSTLIVKLNDLNVYLALVGMGLIFVSAREAFTGMSKKPPTEKKPEPERKPREVPPK